MHQPTKPNHSEAAGAAISHSQNINTPIDVALEFDKMAKEYASLTIDNLVRTDKSDKHLLGIITDFAKQLYRQNLRLIKHKKGFSNYSAPIPLYLSNLGSVSLNYKSADNTLFISLTRGEIQLHLPAFSPAYIWDETLFVELFIYGGEPPKPNQSQNPVFNFFDRLLLDYLTE